MLLPSDAHHRHDSVRPMVGGETPLTGLRGRPPPLLDDRPPGTGPAHRTSARTKTTQHRGARRCGPFSLIGTEGRQAGVYPLRCGSWRCGACARRKTKATAARIAGGIRPGETSWFTLTSPAGEDFATSYERFQARWHRVLQRIRRRVGDIEFVAVIEAQRRGAAHVHVVYRGRPIPKRWLSEAASGAGFGHIVHVGTSVDDGVAGYMTKSLTAELRDPSVAPPPYFRRVRWSRGWGEVVRVWKPRRWPTWHLVAARPAAAATSAMARGYDVVELVGADPPSGSVGDRPVGWYPNLGSLLAGRAPAGAAGMPT